MAKKDSISWTCCSDFGRVYETKTGQKHSKADEQMYVWEMMAGGTVTLHLYFSECATDFTMCYSDIDEAFYDAFCDAYHDAVIIASGDEQLYQLWKNRLETILHKFSGFGWGMDDFIAGEYYLIPRVKEG